RFRVVHDAATGLADLADLADLAVPAAGGLPARHDRHAQPRVPRRRPRRGEGAPLRRADEAPVPLADRGVSGQRKARGPWRARGLEPLRLLAGLGGRGAEDGQVAALLAGRGRVIGVADGESDGVQPAGAVTELVPGELGP